MTRLLRVARTTIFAAALGLSMPAFAQELSASADEADVEFRLGNDAYRSGEFQSALSHYFASYRLVPNRNVIFNIARCYENLDRFVEAYRYYDVYRVDAVDQERENVAKALERISKRVALLEVSSSPPGATIYLNRTDLGAYGVTPALVPVTPGDYEVILEREGYESSKLEKTNAEAGKTAKLSGKLVRREGTLSLSGSPADVTLTFSDGTRVELESGDVIPAPVGEQKVQVEAQGYRTSSLVLDIVENKEVSATYSLDREEGTLVVTSTELNSAILLDGELVGFTPAVLPVTVGEYTLSIRQEGFATYTSEVVVEPNGRMEIDATLSAASEVASASRVAESLRDAPASVSLISSREIDAFGYIGTADALAGLRSVFFTDDLTYKLIGVRGYGPFGQFGNRTQIQLDGHVLNDSWVEASYNDFEILSDIYGLDRIEFVRGPNSVLYGSGAFEGVISLVSPEIDAPYRKSRYGVSASSDGTARTYAHVNHAWEDGGIQLSAGAVGAQGRDVYSPARVGSEEAPDGIARDMGGFDAETARANIQHGDFSLRTFFHRRHKQSPYGGYETIWGDKRSFERDTRAFADLRWERAFESVALETRLYYDYYGYDGFFAYEEEDGGPFTDDFNGHWGGAEVRATIKPFTGARWTFGGEVVRHFVHDLLSESEGDGVALDVSQPFTKASANALVRQDIGSSFAIWAGARFDLWLFDNLPTADGASSESRTINNINPRAVLLWRPVPSGTLKTIFAKGFRAPSVYELTYNDGGFTQVASPGVEPETIYSGELEYTHELPENFEIVGGFFINQITNRIEQRGEGIEDDPLFYTNIDTNLWTGGVETELRRPFFKGWMASVQYAYQRTREGDVDKLFNKSGGLTNSPSHLAAVKLATPIVGRSVQLANRIRYESPRENREGDSMNPVLVWDAVLSGRASALPLGYSLRIHNVLDWTYGTPAGDELLDVAVPQSGRSIWLDVNLEF